MSSPSNPRRESRGISSPNGMQVGLHQNARGFLFFFRWNTVFDILRQHAPTRRNACDFYPGSLHSAVTLRRAALRWTALGATERTAVYRVVYSVRTRLHSRRRGTLSVSRPRETAKINERFAENGGTSRLSDSLSVAILRPERTGARDVCR